MGKFFPPLAGEKREDILKIEELEVKFLSKKKGEKEKIE
jgi:hypothetical protein